MIYLRQLSDMQWIINWIALDQDAGVVREIYETEWTRFRGNGCAFDLTRTVMLSLRNTSGRAYAIWDTSERVYIAFCVSKSTRHYSPPF